MLNVRFPAASALAMAWMAAIGAPIDDQMQKLALDSGCMVCHTRAAKAEGNSPPPAAPAWNAIARQYRGQAGVEDRLVDRVLHGSGPGRRHWQVSIVAMPPNAVEIGEHDARALVRWILQQK